MILAVVLKEIHYYQKLIDLFISKLSFQYLMCEII